MSEKEAIVQVATMLDKLERPNELKLSSGAVVKPVEIPDMLIQMLYANFPAPKAPMVEIHSGGKHWVQENPDDPRYAETLAERDRTLSAAMINLVLVRGMTVLTLPEGCPLVEDTSWEEELAVMGMVVPETGTARKLIWLKRFIVTRSLDLATVQTAALELSGATEEAVQEAMDRFRSES